MKAVVKDKPELGISVMDMPKPPVRFNEVLLRVRRASICGSDIGLYGYTPAYAGFAKLPIIPGHEFAGEVAEVGRDVTEFKVGDRAVAESIVSCGHCKLCRLGQTNLCVNFKILGMHTNGGFSENASVQEKHVHHLKDNVTFREAALIEPSAVVCHGLLDVAKLEPSDFVTVLGPGPIGLLAAQVARASGSREVLVTGIPVDEKRLQLAKRLGFESINSGETNPIQRTLESTDGIGADVAVVAAGAAEALVQACQLVRKGGKIINIGIFSKPVELPVTDLVRRQVSISGTFASTWVNYEQAIDLISSKKLNVEALVTHEYTLDEATPAFEVAMARVGCKVQFSM